MKANATTNKVNEIVKRGYITESKINLLKNRVNNGRADVCELDDLGGLAITEEQTELNTMIFGNVIINEPNDLIGSLVNFGGDPSLIETDEQASEVFESLNKVGSGGRELTEGEFETAKRQLDLDNIDVSHIWSFVDGSEFIICFSECWS